MNGKVEKRLAFIINVVFIAVVGALVYLAFKYVAGWVLPFLLAFIIVSLLHPLVSFIERKLKINQKVVSLIVMLLIYVLVAVLLFLLIMQLFILFRDGLSALPAYYEQSVQPALTAAGDSINDFIRELPPEFREQVTRVQDEILRTLQTFLLDLSKNGVSFVSNMTTRIPSFLITFVFTIMLSFFIGMQYESVLGFFRIQFSSKAKRVIRELRSIVMDTIVKYFRAALTLMMITFVELTIGLLAIQTSNAIPIAAGIAVFDALPFLGTGAIMIPWCLIELLQGNYRFAFGLAIIYGIVTVIRNIIEPKIVGDKLGLNPIVSLTAIYVGFKLFGVLGMIFMPILTQIAMELHHNGTIKLFKEKVEATDDKKKPPETDSDAEVESES